LTVEVSTLEPATVPETRRGRPQQRHIWGEAIFDYLTEQDRATRAQIVRATGLTSSQFGLGIKYLREVLCDDRTQPIGFNPRTKEWVLSDTWAQQKPDARWHARYLLTRVKTAERSLRISREKFGDAAVPRTIMVQAERLHEDLAVHLATLEASDGAEAVAA
jgi:hypothetical protein